MNLPLKPCFEFLESRHLMSTSPAGFDPPDAARSSGAEPPITVAAQSASAAASFLQPGPGFTGPTAQPPARGSGPGVDAQAIARWDVVPNQTFTGRFDVGVLAFHRAGIDSVAFSVEGGPWTYVGEPTENPRTGVVEYWASLDAARLSDGPVEVRAIAIPTAGIPRVLEPLTLNANAGGTLRSIARYVSPNGSDANGTGDAEKPFKTIGRAAQAIASASPDGTADGGFVYLLPGTHVFDGGSKTVPTKDRWLTITPAPGVDAKYARIVGSENGLSTKWLRVEGVVAQNRPDEVLLPADRSLGQRLWIDNSSLRGAGRLDPGHWYQRPNRYQDTYVTNTYATDSRDGFIDATLQRDVRLGTIGRDAFSKTEVVVHSHVEKMDKSGSSPSFHSDVYQLGKSARKNNNIILYGVTATQDINGQGFFIGNNRTVTDLAVVNSYFDNQNRPDADKKRVFQVSSPAKHLLVQDSTFVGKAVWRDDRGFTADDVVIDSTAFLTADGQTKTPGERPGVAYLSGSAPALSTLPAPDAGPAPRDTAPIPAPPPAPEPEPTPTPEPAPEPAPRPRPDTTPAPRPSPAPTDDPAPPPPTRTRLDIAPVVGVTASGYNERRDDRPANVLDADPTTRWAQEGAGSWIQFDLGQSRSVDSLYVSWFKGDRRAAGYEVLTSRDGDVWTRSADGTSSGQSDGYERIGLEAVQARYVRLVGLGNSRNDWVSVNDVVPLITVPVS